MLGGLAAARGYPRRPGALLRPLRPPSPPERRGSTEQGYLGAARRRCRTAGATGANRGMRDRCCQDLTEAGAPRSPRVPPGSSRRGTSELSVLPFRTSKAPGGTVSAARSLRTGTSREGGYPPGLFGTGKGLPGLPTPPSRTLPSGDGAVERCSRPTHGRNQNRTPRVRRLEALGELGVQSWPPGPLQPTGLRLAFCHPGASTGAASQEHLDLLPNIWRRSRLNHPLPPQLPGRGGAEQGSDIIKKTYDITPRGRMVPDDGAGTAAHPRSRALAGSRVASG